MDVGIYQGAMALSTLERWQDVLSQNIAAATVNGYKKSEVNVQGMAFGAIQDSANSKAASAAAIMPMSGEKVSFLPGEMKRTGNPTDFAIGGNGFFAVRQSDGALRYTRNGEFSVNAQNQLVTASGEPVQGAGGPISLLPGGQEMSVDASGKIYQNNQLVGTLAVYDFADPSKLSKVSGGFKAEAGTQATQVSFPNIAQGHVEGSNVSAIDEMVKLIQVTRAQEANQKIITAHDQRLSRVIQTFNQ